MGWLGARGTKLGSDERTLTRTCTPGRRSPRGVSGGMGDRPRSWARGRNCPSAAQQRVCSAPCPAAAASAADAKAVPRKRLDKHTAMAAETRKALGMLADDADDAEEEEGEPASAPARPAPAYELPPESPPPQGPAAVTAPTPPPQTHAVPMQPQQQQALQMLLQQLQQQLNARRPMQLPLRRWHNRRRTACHRRYQAPLLRWVASWAQHSPRGCLLMA